MPRPEVRFIVGLPGSGKTPRLMRLQMEGWGIFDDYKARAHGDSTRFRSALRYAELVEALRDGKRCAVADMAFCRLADREEARKNLEEDVPGVVLHWDFFENDPQQCAENIRRGERPPAPRLAKLAEFSPQYSPPSGTTFLPVTRDEM